MSRYTYLKKYSAKLDPTFNDKSFDKFKNLIKYMRNKLKDIDHEL